jgi:hypothetical protein
MSGILAGLAYIYCVDIVSNYSILFISEDYFTIFNFIPFADAINVGGRNFRFRYKFGIVSHTM